MLIQDIAELCMSRYVSVRKAAQRAIDPISSLYDGTKSMLLETFFAALQRELRCCISIEDRGQADVRLVQLAMTLIA